MCLKRVANAKTHMVQSHQHSPVCCCFLLLPLASQMKQKPSVLGATAKPRTKYSMQPASASDVFKMNRYLYPTTSVHPVSVLMKATTSRAPTTIENNRTKDRRLKGWKGRENQGLESNGTLPGWKEPLPLLLLLLRTSRPQQSSVMNYHEKRVNRALQIGTRKQSGPFTGHGPARGSVQGVVK